MQKRESVRFDNFVTIGFAVSLVDNIALRFVVFVKVSFQIVISLFNRKRKNHFDVFENF